MIRNRNSWILFSVLCNSQTVNDGEPIGSSRSNHKAEKHDDDALYNSDVRYILRNCRYMRNILNI